MKAIVVGAGLAGLTAARALQRGGAEVRVLEAERDIGGRVRSRHVDGFTLDRGFQVLFTAYPAVKRHLDLDRLSLRSFAPSAVLVFPDGRRERVGDPLRDRALLLESLQAQALSPTDKLRVARLAIHAVAAPRLRPLLGTWLGPWLSAGLPDQDRDDQRPGVPGAPDETTRSYLREFGFSDRAVTNFFEPFFGGIFLDRSLSTSARLFRYYLRMLVEGAIAVPAAGMGAIPAQLAEGIDVTVGTRVEHVEATHSGVIVRGAWGEIHADAAVIATDPPELQRLGVADAPTDAVGATYLHYAADTAVDPEARLLLGVGEGVVSNAVWMSNVAPEYAPRGHHLLNVTVLDGEQMSEDALDDAVRKRLTTWYGSGAADALRLLAVDRIPFAQFAQPPGYDAALADVRSRIPNMVVASEATRFSSIEGAMEAGEQAAAVLLGDRTVLARPRGV